jgi:hypothetical protein
MSALPSPADLVLVAFLPHPRNLEIARVLGWYHMPLRSAPKVIAVDWLAFYQPATFGDGHKWCIEYIAPVKGNELVTRLDLFKDQPDHPNAYEEYFKLQLGSLVTLPRPIPAGDWKRVTFLYTTGEHLITANEIGELTVRDEERVILWQALRERAAEQDEYRVVDHPDSEIPAEILKMFFLTDGGSPKIEF